MDIDGKHRSCVNSRRIEGKGAGLQQTPKQQRQSSTEIRYIEKSDEELCGTRREQDGVSRVCTVLSYGSVGSLRRDTNKHCEYVYVFPCAGAREMTDIESDGCSVSGVPKVFDCRDKLIIKTKTRREFLIKLPPPLRLYVSLRLFLDKLKLLSIDLQVLM
ncbi:hypothetical protein RUM43_012627 [Polyplax serrata]|uniref:Uncharacterized protein n=1 Tax=Polyplax serrata TaxID=468196 RepID=A0AAN8P5W0_POLSC